MLKHVKTGWNRLDVSATATKALGLDSGTCYSVLFPVWFQALLLFRSSGSIEVKWAKYWSLWDATRDRVDSQTHRGVYSASVPLDTSAWKAAWGTDMDLQAFLWEIKCWGPEAPSVVTQSWLELAWSWPLPVIHVNVDQYVSNRPRTSREGQCFFEVPN